MKRPISHLYRGLFAVLLVLTTGTADGQQPATAEPSAASEATAKQAPPSAPPLVQLNEHPRTDSQDNMQMLNPVHGHPAPVPESASSVLPEMVPDGNGGVRIARADESFSNLTLEGSTLKAEEPVFGGREIHPTFIRELWQLKWRPNDPIDLYIILPRNVEKPPVVLYLYGFPDDTDRFKYDPWCERVTRNGAAAIGFVSALTGQRYAHRPFSQYFISELPESLASTVHDVQMILNQLKTRQDLDLGRIGMFAQGSGAAIAILAAAVDGRIQALDLLDAWGDWPDWFAKANAFPEDERAKYLKTEYQKKLEPLEPAKHLPELKNIKLRMQFTQENGVPESARASLKASAPSNADVREFRTSRDLYDAYSGGQLFSWIASQLHAGPVESGQVSSSSPTTLPAASRAQ